MARPSTAPQDPQRALHSERPAWAWKRVNEANNCGKVTTEYAIQARKLPARIQTNGLGQTLAFLYSKSKGDKSERKGDKGETLLLIHLGERIKPLLQSDRDLSDPDKIMHALVHMTPDEYRRCTHELMVSAEWLKRFADGLFEKGSE
ncbi:MAG: type III-B CRISPR module-associated protein Cmr5 [Candidatus Eisenbacteria bacterium]|nr:type III-B CRISPR module-associated protein Cmr5 [Candidatus Eisenbacteria bacterium]